VKDAAYPRPLIAWFAVGLLVVASLISYVDRQVVAIVVGPMKADLALSDTQLGWLYGIFALSYAIAGVPIARLADRGNRRNLIAVGVFVWSAMTMVCGLVGNFAQVLLARIGVGIGEATLVPSASSMIGDLFSRERIPFAVSVFTAGSVLGSGIAFVVGGAILSAVENSGLPVFPFMAGMAPWKQVFIIVGAPGLLLVPVLLLLREPLRRTSAAPQATTDTQAILDFYRRNRATILLHHSGFMALSLMGFCFVFWSVSFFTRVHGMQASSASQIFGWIFLLAGPWGGVWAAAFAKRLAAKGARDANITAAMIGGGMMIPCVLLIEFMPTPLLAFVFYVPAMFFNTSPFGLAYGSLPVIAPPRIRATVTSVFMFVVSLGMLLGPPLAGFFNQHVFPTAEGVRYSLITVTVLCGGLGVALLALSRKHYARSLERADALEAGA
jgi:MFS family permease